MVFDKTSMRWKCMAWLQEHPGATGPDATKAGLSQGTAQGAWRDGVYDGTVKGVKEKGESHMRYTLLVSLEDAERAHYDNAEARELAKVRRRSPSRVKDALRLGHTPPSAPTTNPKPPAERPSLVSQVSMEMTLRVGDKTLQVTEEEAYALYSYLHKRLDALTRPT